MSEVFLQDNQDPKETSRRTAEAFKRLGTRLLVSLRDRVGVQFTNANFTDAGSTYRPFSTAFTTSGGLVEVDVVLRAYMAVVTAGKMELLIDDDQKDEAISLGQDTDSISLSFKGNLPPGRHTVKVRCRRSIGAGTFFLNDDGSTGSTTSTLFVKETLGG